MRWIFLIFCFLLALNFPLAVNSVSMSSENFQISVETVSVGGDLATSTNYQVVGATAEGLGMSVTQSTSTNYIVEAGFPSMISDLGLSVTLSTNAIALGTLSSLTVASGSQTLTVTTNSPSGYTTTILEDGNLRSGGNDINDVADGTVTVGSEEYGIRSSGAAGQMNNADTALTAAAQTVASTSTVALAEQTTITYNAAVSQNTAYGTYSQTVTFTTTANY